MTRIITLAGTDGSASGRVAADLAERLCAAGRRVCLLALSGGADTAGGLPPGWSDITTLADSLAGEREASVLQLGSGCDLLLGSRDTHWLRHLEPDQLTGLAERLRPLGDYDYLLVDAGAGSEQNRLAFALASPRLLLVTDPGNDALNQAYSLLKVLYAEQYEGSVGVLVNDCEDPASGRQTYDKLRGTAGFYLDMPLSLAGIVERADTATGLDQLGAALLAEDPPDDDSDMAAFTRRYLRAAGALPATEQEVASLVPVFAESSDARDLQVQLEQLSGQVDALIDEVGRLRGDDAQPAEQAAQPPAPTPPPDRIEPCDVACIAALASSSEAVTSAGETFSVYRFRQPDGRQLRFACQGIDDDMEEPEPRSRLS